MRRKNRVEHSGGRNTSRKLRRERRGTRELLIAQMGDSTRSVNRTNSHGTMGKAPLRQAVRRARAQQEARHKWLST